MCAGRAAVKGVPLEQKENWVEQQSAAFSWKKLLSQVYSKVSSQTFDEISRLKKPSKLAFDSCKLLAMFVNMFREHNTRWPDDSFASWPPIQSFLITDPAKLLKETQLLKRFFYQKPVRLSNQTKEALLLMRDKFLQ